MTIFHKESYFGTMLCQGPHPERGRWSWGCLVKIPSKSRWNVWNIYVRLGGCPRIGWGKQDVFCQNVEELSTRSIDWWNLDKFGGNWLHCFWSTFGGLRQCDPYHPSFDGILSHHYVSHTTALNFVKHSRVGIMYFCEYSRHHGSSGENITRNIGSTPRGRGPASWEVEKS